MADLLEVLPARSAVDTVADLARKYLDRHQPSDYRLVVNRNAIRHGARRWLVQVDAEAQGKEIRADDCADRKVAAQVELDRDFPRYIRLMPIVPDPGEAL